MKASAVMLTIAKAVDEDAGMLQGTRLQELKAHPEDDHGAGENLPEVDGFFPTGTGGGPSCTDENGERYKGKFEDCTHKDFFVWKGDVREEFTSPTYSGRGSDGHWSTIPVNRTGGWQAHCVAYVKTKGGTCNEWCDAKGLVCQKGMDDAHHQTADLSTWLGDAATDCSLSPVSAARPEVDQSDNGCNAKWDTQVCACAYERKPTIPPLCSWPLNDANGNAQLDSETGLPPLAVEDCSHGDFHAYKGHVRGVAGFPSYPANTYGSDDKWSTVTVDKKISDIDGACVAYVDWGQHASKKVGTCAEWCTSIGMSCVGGMDDAHWQHHELTPWLSQSGFQPTYCTLYPGGHERQKTDDNGCEQSWQTHICACKVLQ